ncbi:MAG: SH3 domain-containing protein [Chloroflexi bacterium]|nr:SH3 domain-containing protein [Chloroflexota bacterium]
MQNEFDRPELPPYEDEVEEWTPEEVAWGVDEPEQPGIYPRVARAGSSRSRRRLGRSMTLRGLLGLLLLLLLAVAVWWGARMIFPPAEATPTPAAAATLPPLATPTPAVTTAATVSVATPMPSPTPTPRAPAISVGQTVRIGGTDEEGIRFRLGPGLDYVTLGVLEEGVSLKVLEGPEQADGFVWWRLEMEDGTIGWAADDWLEPVSGTD